MRTTNKTSKMIVLVPGIALPERMGFLLVDCKPAYHTLRAVRAGHLLRIDYHPPYIQLECSNVEKIVSTAKKRRLRVYRARSHTTITDGIYTVRVYGSRREK